jgi:hypothetical protein
MGNPPSKSKPQTQGAAQGEVRGEAIVQPEQEAVVLASTPFESERFHPGTKGALTTRFF